MKAIRQLLLLFALCIVSLLQAQNVGINTSTPDASAALDVTSTTQGVLVPRMTQAQRTIIATPATGLLVYQTDGSAGFYFYDGASWVAVSGSGPVGPQGATGLLTSGAVAGNTPYWSGSAWVVNNSNIHNNGAGVGIGTTNPSASAKVEIASTTQGFLPPRMTTAQRDAITSPSIGLVIYNTTTNCLNYFVGGGWIQTCGSVEQPIVQPIYPAGSVFCSGTTLVVNVLNPATGKIWMDRNLGATQAATSSTDEAAYGDLYQWGRRSDGHQCRTSATTATLSSIDQPANGNFILAPSIPYDWRSPQNTNLWQGVNGVNNPCPSGYRIPTGPELEAERLSWSVNTSVGAFASALKLSRAGARYYDGSVNIVGKSGEYWGSTIYLDQSRFLLFTGPCGPYLCASVPAVGRSYGLSVRCIKD